MSSDQELLVQVKQKAQAWTQAPHDEETRQTVTRWLEGCDEDPALREALIDAFYTELSFGTGGLRGKMGPPAIGAAVAFGYKWLLSFPSSPSCNLEHQWDIPP